MKTTISRKERTIQSETRRIFLLIFAILVTVGLFTVASTLEGSFTYGEARNNQLRSYRLMENIKQKALEITSIYYALASNQDQDILMKHLLRYEGLAKDFNQSVTDLTKHLDSTTQDEPEATPTRNRIEIISHSFEKLNNHCREMTFALMENKPELARPTFKKIDDELGRFKAEIDELEQKIISDLDTQLDRSQVLLQRVSILGIALTAGSILISLVLIRGLTQFLSITLIPISNMMNTMRQSVFAISKDLRVIHPASRYSKDVFREDIVNKNLVDLILPQSENLEKQQSRESAELSLKSSLGEDEIQWLLSKEHLPTEVELARTDFTQTLKLSYTPLWSQDQKLDSVLIIAEDISELVALRNEAKKTEAEISTIRELALAGRHNLQTYLDDSFEKVEGIKLLNQSRAIHSQTELSLILHTLKGNAGMINLKGLAAQLHELENRLNSESSNLPLETFIDQLQSGIVQYADVAQKVLGVNSAWIKDDSLPNGTNEKAIVISNRRWRSLIRSTLGGKTLDAPSAQTLASWVLHLNQPSLFDYESQLQAMTEKLSTKCGKQIQLSVSGTDIPLPAPVMRQTLDAIGHLVRNSIDHGVESPEARAKKGKNTTGSILILTSQKPGRRVFQIKDDGGGINTGKILEKAVSNGVITEGTESALSIQEKWNLIFAPGLSTKESVSEISGRGVGMSAAAESIRKLGGSLTVLDSSSQGTTFEISLPNEHTENSTH